MTFIKYKYRLGCLQTLLRILKKGTPHTDLKNFTD